MPIPGQVTERIRFVRKLNHGGTGEVWLADDELGRPVAVKVLRSDLSVSEPNEYANRLHRLEREARLLAAFDHPNIVRIYHLVHLQKGDLGLVMEYVPFGTLKDYLANPHPNLTETSAAEIAEGAAAALDLVHDPSHAIVHRDIKPGNLFWAPGQVLKIADFGVAQVASEQTRTIHSIHDHPGTPLYMSPEQANRQPLLDGRSDQFSLAQSIYEALTGHVKSDTYPSLLVERADITPTFASALLKALSSRREERFETCGEFAAALRVSANDLTTATAGWPRSDAKPAIWLRRFAPLIGALGAVLVVGGMVAASGGPLRPIFAGALGGGANSPAPTQQVDQTTSPVPSLTPNTTPTLTAAPTAAPTQSQPPVAAASSLRGLATGLHQVVRQPEVYHDPFTNQTVEATLLTVEVTSANTIVTIQIRNLSSAGTVAVGMYCASDGNTEPYATYLLDTLGKRYPVQTKGIGTLECAPRVRPGEVVSGTLYFGPLATEASVAEVKYTTFDFKNVQVVALSPFGDDMRVSRGSLP